MAPNKTVTIKANGKLAVESCAVDIGVGVEVGVTVGVVDTIKEMGSELSLNGPTS